MADRRRNPNLAVEAWNKQIQVGAAVAFRKDNGKSIVTRMRSEASVLGGHTPVVWIEGWSGCVALERVSPIEEEPVDSAEWTGRQ